MGTMIFTGIFLLAGLFCLRLLPQIIAERANWERRFWSVVGCGVCWLIACFLALSTSYVIVKDDHVGHLRRVYLGFSLPEGQIIATKGEMGPQAEVLPPGFQFKLFLNVLYDVDTTHMIENISNGKYGFLTARDGKELPTGATFADALPEGKIAEMVSNATIFLTKGGQKGPQTSILPPGKYRLNRYLWQVDQQDAEEIPVGFVGIITSYVHTAVHIGSLQASKPEMCEPIMRKGNEYLAVSTVVPVGCIGIWDKVLGPGKYYLNKKAYQVTHFDTRGQNWTYTGGYKKRFIVLKVDQQGQITQTPGEIDVPTPENAADKAIFVRVEGWEVPLELRVLAQVSRENAPYVVAGVGGLLEIEDRILTPTIRSLARNVVGSQIPIPTEVDDGTGQKIVKRIMRPTRVYDLMEYRDAIETYLEELLKPEGLKAGIDIKEVRLGEPAIPPEVLIARQREQLAQQLAHAYDQEKLAQEKRILAEQSRATADQQAQLVQAQIEVKRAQQFALARRSEGEGEKNKLELIAEGQKAQVNVLGQDSTVALRKFEFVWGRLLDFMREHPEVLTTGLSQAHKLMPERLFILGGNTGNSLPAAAGILGDFIGERGSAKDVPVK